MYLSMIFFTDVDIRYTLIFYVFQIFGYFCFALEFVMRVQFIYVNWGKEISYGPGMGNIGRDRYAHGGARLSRIRASTAISEKLF